MIRDVVLRDVVARTPEIDAVEKAGCRNYSKGCLTPEKNRLTLASQSLLSVASSQTHATVPSLRKTFYLVSIF